MIFKKSIVVYGLSFVAFFSLSHAKSDRSDLAINSIRMEVEKDDADSVTRDNICSKDKICRKFNGNSCESKIVFSVCWVFCNKDYNDFKESACVKALPLQFNAKRETFSDGQTPSAYLIEAVKSESKLHMHAYLLCEGVCKIVKSKKGAMFFSEIKDDLEKACLQGCTTGEQKNN